MARLNPAPLKDHLRETLLFNRRLIAGLFIAGGLVLVLVARLAQLQILEHDHYTTLSENNRVSIEPVAPTRGLIYDRNGVLLAQNLPSFRLEIVPEHVPDMEATLDRLRKLVRLDEADLARFRQTLKRKRRFEGVPLRFRLSDEEVARVSVHRHRLPGVFIRAELARHYPLGRLAAHAVGYVGRISEAELAGLSDNLRHCQAGAPPAEAAGLLRHVDEETLCELMAPSNYAGTWHMGKVGIERYYEYLLHGRVGYQKVETNAQGRVLKVLERTLPVPGRSLYLNLDVRLQRAAETAFGDHNGALVALEPRTGAVLALVSMPGYDPNRLVADYRRLTASPDRPLFNRAIQGQYPPGSTLKPFIALAGLELDMMQASDSILCPGYYLLKGDERRYRDWKKEGHGGVDMERAIVESCDVYFYDLALALGIDRIHDYLARFGFGRRTGIDLPGELPGLLPSREWKRRHHGLPWFPGETLITGIGQGFTLTTPLQLAEVTATLANGGRRLHPQLVRALADAEGVPEQTVPPRSAGEVGVRVPAHWQAVVRAMRRVVHSVHGTARGIGHNVGYAIAGKTGTAQVFGIKEDEEYVEEEIAKRLRDHALFIAFAPVEDPRIAVAVIVENGGSGGTVAAPVARAVMDAWLATEEGDVH